MATRDLHNNIKVVQTVSPVAAQGNPPTDLHAEVDAIGYEAIEHIVTLGVAGTVLSSSVKVELKIEDSPDNSVWAPVTDNNQVLGQTVGAGGLFATVDDLTEDDTHIRIGYLGRQRFSRVVLDF